MREQIGGTHYSDLAIEPIDFITANNLGFCEGNIVKYIARWKAKNGIEDLKKARWYIDFLIESLENETENTGDYTEQRSKNGNKQ